MRNSLLGSVHMYTTRTRKLAYIDSRSQHTRNTDKLAHRTDINDAAASQWLLWQPEAPGVAVRE